MVLTAVPRQPASVLSRDPDTAIQVTMATRRPTPESGQSTVVLVETAHGDKEHAADVNVNTHITNAQPGGRFARNVA